MKIILDYTSDLPMYEQVVKGIKDLIIDGSLKENDLLPSVRKLSQELNVSTITIKRAYLELEKAGITYSVSGVGTFVRVKDNEELINENKEKLFCELDDIVGKLLDGKCTKEEIIKRVENLLEIKDLSIEIKNFALKNVSFCVPRGTVLGFIGQNGAGKTTTLKLILNSYKRASGEIRVLGKDNIKDEIFVKNNIGYVPAESYLIDNKTIEEHEETFEFFYDKWDHKLYMEYIKNFGIDMNKKCGDLSTGMKTKAMLALALAHDPQILILDEPTSGLDPVARLEFLDMLRDFVGDGEKSVILSTHITSDLDKVADYIALIHEGRILEFDSMDNIQESFAVVKGDLSEIVGYEDDFIGIKKWDDSFEGLIKREKLVGELKNLRTIVPNIENLLSFHIWGNKK
ncbi:MAG: ATP-binding cassette domain-containing protein [Clostridium paraputrificum]